MDGVQVLLDGVYVGCASQDSLKIITLIVNAIYSCNSSTIPTQQSTTRIYCNTYKETHFSTVHVHIFSMDIVGTFTASQ